MSVMKADSRSFHCPFCRRGYHDVGYTVMVGDTNIFVCGKCVSQVRLIAQELESFIAEERVVHELQQREASNRAMLELAAALNEHTRALLASKAPGLPSADPTLLDAKPTAPAEQQPTGGSVGYHCHECGCGWNGPPAALQCNNPKCGSFAIVENSSCVSCRKG